MLNTAQYSLLRLFTKYSNRRLLQNIKYTTFTKYSTHTMLITVTLIKYACHDCGQICHLNPLILSGPFSAGSTFIFNSSHMLVVFVRSNIWYTKCMSDCVRPLTINVARQSMSNAIFCFEMEAELNWEFMLDVINGVSSLDKDLYNVKNNKETPKFLSHSATLHRHNAWCKIWFKN